MTREAADSLRKVSDDLKAHGYRLKIYDAYRPQRGVDHFMRWATVLDDTVTKAYFYPNLTKKQVFDGEYVATKSGHSRGSTVDLTILDMKTGKEVDMGGTFDWFGPESHPDYGGGNPETLEFVPTDSAFTSVQFYNRMVLRTAMLRHGFKPLDNEWWHFTLKNEPFPDTYFNFPVRKLEK
jgi:D-alanyl-D-alanine dipeptidase